MYTHRMLLLPLLLTLGPSALAQEVPAPLRALKPYEIVGAVAAERQTLGLTETQIIRLQSLEQAVLKEPHRFEPVPSQKLNHAMRMKPMLSRERAYADALAILTPEQRVQAAEIFGDREYQLPAELRPVATERLVVDALHHAVGRVPAEQAGRRAAPAHPLRHIEGAAGLTEPSANQDGSAPNPLTHKE